MPSHLFGVGVWWVDELRRSDILILLDQCMHDLFKITTRASLAPVSHPSHTTRSPAPPACRRMPSPTRMHACYTHVPARICSPSRGFIECPRNCSCMPSCWDDPRPAPPWTPSPPPGTAAWPRPRGPGPRAAWRGCSSIRACPDADLRASRVLFAAPREAAAQRPRNRPGLLAASQHIRSPHSLAAHHRTQLRYHFT